MAMNILSHAMCARNECKNTRPRRLKLLRAHSRVHVVLRVDVSKDHGFHVVIGVGRLHVQHEGFIRQLHVTTHTQHQVQSSFLLDVVVRLCPVIVNSIGIQNSCIISHRENGSFEVLSLHLPSVTVDRHQL